MAKQTKNIITKERKKVVAIYNTKLYELKD